MRISQGYNMVRNVILLIVLVSAVRALASDGSSGCGLGWMVTKRKSLISSAVRASTNATFLNSVGMTLGTSGCDRHDIVKQEKKQIHYLEANHEQLIVEAAQGQGEYLVGLANVMGCESASFSRGVQRHYGQLYPNMSVAPQAVYEQLVQQAALDAELAQSCGVI